MLRVESKAPWELCSFTESVSFLLGLARFRHGRMKTGMFDVRGLMFDVGVKPSLYRLFKICILVRIRRRAAAEKA